MKFYKFMAILLFVKLNELRISERTAERENVLNHLQIESSEKRRKKFNHENELQQNCLNATE